MWFAGMASTLSKKLSFRVKGRALAPAPTRAGGVYTAMRPRDCILRTEHRPSRVLAVSSPPSKANDRHSHTDNNHHRQIE